MYRTERLDVTTSDEGFRSIAEEAEPRLRRAFILAYGPERGREATAEALAYGWEHWPKVQSMNNPYGYRFRVGQSRTRSRRIRLPFSRPTGSEPLVEPALPGVLATLSERQRLAVVLVHSYGWTLREVAELTGTSVGTIQVHLERGMARLRAGLEVNTHD
jgi:DNA-directed RNA polymerase specialized sigma24 family protein